MALYCALGLLCMFTVLQLRIVWSAQDVMCGCYGPYMDSRVSAVTIGRNMVFILAAVFSLHAKDLGRLIPRGEI